MTSFIQVSRSDFIVWLRKTHGWIGLWGATLGLLFGFSGIWLNHRAVLPLQAATQRQSDWLPLERPQPADAKVMAAWLQQALGGLPAPTVVRVAPSAPVPWAEPAAPDVAPAIQPEHWTFYFSRPRQLIQADYWVGNHAVAVTRTENGFIAVLKDLHQGIGMSTGWILLVDTLAGGMILLSLSGVSLWMLTRRKRTVGIVIFGSALALTVGLVLMRL